MKKILFLIVCSISIMIFTSLIPNAIAADSIFYDDINLVDDGTDADPPIDFKLEGETFLRKFSNDKSYYWLNDSQVCVPKDIALSYLAFGTDAGTNHIQEYTNCLQDEASCSEANNDVCDFEHSSRNIFIGDKAGRDLERGKGNIFIGNEAGVSGGLESAALNLTPRLNVFIGEGANGWPEAQYDGYNTIIGGTAGFANSAGYNTFIGAEAGKFSTTGSGNVFIGANAAAGHYRPGTQNYSAVEDGSRNIHIGYHTEVAEKDISHSIALGTMPVVYDSNQMVVGSDLFSECDGSDCLDISNCDPEDADCTFLGINDSYWGSAVRAERPQPFSFNASGGKGDDVTGADLIIAGGKGTTTANGGNIIFKTALANNLDLNDPFEEQNALIEVMRIDSNGSVDINPVKTDEFFRVGLDLTTIDFYSGSTKSGGARALNVLLDHKGTPTNGHYGIEGANYIVRLSGDGNFDSGLVQQNQILFNSDNSYDFTYLFGNSVQLTAAGAEYSGTHRIDNYVGYFSYAFSNSQTLNGTDWRHAHFTDFPDFGGTVDSVTGLWIDKQTYGTNNYGIVLDGDGAGADIVFGPNQNVSLYSKSDNKLYANDGINETQVSPHDPVTNEWVFYSKNLKTGKVLRVNMEDLVRDMEKLTGKKYLVESFVKDK